IGALVVDDVHSQIVCRLKIALCIGKRIICAGKISSGEHGLSGRFRSAAELPCTAGHVSYTGSGRLGRQVGDGKLQIADDLLIEILHGARVSGELDRGGLYGIEDSAAELFYHPPVIEAAKEF